MNICRADVICETHQMYRTSPTHFVQISSLSSSIFSIGNQRQKVRQGTFSLSSLLLNLKLLFRPPTAANILSGENTVDVVNDDKYSLAHKWTLNRQKVARLIDGTFLPFFYTSESRGTKTAHVHQAASTRISAESSESKEQSTSERSYVIPFRSRFRRQRFPRQVCFASRLLSCFRYCMSHL